MIWLMSGKGSIDKRGSAWRIRWRAADGTRRTKTVHGSKKAAQKLLREMLDRETAVAAGLEDHLGMERSLEELAQAYLKGKRLELAEESFRDLESGLTRVVDELGVRRVGDLRLETLVAYRSDRLTGAIRTRNKIAGHFRSMIQWAAATRLIGRDMLSGYRPIKQKGVKPVVRRHAMSSDEVLRVLAAADELDSERDLARERVPQAPTLEIYAWTGLRGCEVASLQWRDFEGDWLDIREPAKGGLERKLPVVPRLRSVLEDLRCRQGAWIGRLPGPQDRIALGARGGPLTEGARRYVRRLLRRAAERAEIEVPEGLRLDLHAQRHTFVCLMRDQGVDIETARLLLGHKSTQMIQRVYGRSNRAPFAEAAGRLSELAEKPVKGESSGSKAGPNVS